MGTVQPEQGRKGYQTALTVALKWNNTN